MSSDVSHHDYIACLPEHWQGRATVEPESSYWPWRDISLHVLKAPRPTAKARLLILHGAGGHAGALWPAAAIAANIGFEVLAPDLPGYGRTRVPNPGAVRYPHWVDCVTDLVRAELAADPRPLVVCGASMGGLLGYSACARAGGVAHLLATCFLDPGNPVTWPALSRWGGSAGVHLSRPLLKRLCRPGASGLANLRVPIRWLAAINRIANNAQLTQLCRVDARGGGSSVPLGFIASFLFSEPALPPEQFRDTPVTLIHPGNDRWTPPEMSLAFFDRIAAPKRYVELENCGHFPVEEPGLTTLANEFESLYNALAKGAEVGLQQGREQAL